MSSIPAFLRRLVLRRAHGRCEYCRLSQAGQEATFHIDHIIPVTAGGHTSSENLALACVSCSLRKGARMVVEDAQTGEPVRLFHPRLDQWDDHFEWDKTRLVGRTNVGITTITALDMNRPLILGIRAEETLLGRHPG